jgi:MFS family permease
VSTIPVAAPPQAKTSYAVLMTISFCHFLNDMIQSLLPAIYPILKGNFHLDFGQVGMITFVNQLTASLLQPVVGSFTDKRPQPHSLSIGMAFTLCGLVLLSLAASFPMILLAAAILFGVTFWLAGGHLSLNLVSLAVLGVIAVSLFLLYFGSFTLVTAATPGQSYLGIKVCNLEGAPPTWHESWWRSRHSAARCSRQWKGRRR